MDISFSIRFENILKITNSFVGRGRDATEARQEAQYMEGEILKNAQSNDEYQQLCNELLSLTVKEDSPPALNEPEEDDDEIFNTEGPTIGQYCYGTFHKDGQMSTILKAKAIEADAHVRIVALKITTPSRMHPPHNSQREARILIECRSGHVVTLIESFWYHGDQLVLAFPFFRQDLENLLRTGSLTRSQSQMVYSSLFTALAHIHSKGIIHRDVKPSNILLKTMDGPVVLADFGIAWSPIDPQSEAPGSKITDVGTTCYRPPELLFGHRSYDTSLDMWAAGCVVAEMVRKNHEQLFDPGPLGSELGLIKSIFTTLGTPNEQIWPSVTKFPDWAKVRFQEFPAKPWEELLQGATSESVDFMQRTVCYESSKRLTAAQALEHALITKVKVQM